MSYIYQAALYCDACGERLKRDVITPTYPAPWDSGDYPAHVQAGESDSPDHCDRSRNDCLGDTINLHDWGLAEDAPLYGAETAIIGELVSNKLTTDGVEYLREMLVQDHPSDLTPYQRALHVFWRAAFSDYL